ncbi:hypothetical protein DRJ04_09315, partial [Candidatus Aerophobetes bacterium]
ISIRNTQAIFNSTGTNLTDVDYLQSNPTLNISCLVYRNLDNPINSVWINITLPNGTDQTYFLQNTSSRNQTQIWYITLNTSKEFQNLLGNYTVTFFANSTLSNGSVITQEIPAPTTQFSIEQMNITITLYSPENNAVNTTDRTPDFTFKPITTHGENLSCTVYLNNGTLIPIYHNSSVPNATITVITSNTTLLDGNYTWWVNCSAEYSVIHKQNQSEIRNLSIQIIALECSSCAECSRIIQKEALSGDTVQLTADITNTAETCISFGGTDNITFDCTGHTIQGNNSGYGIWLNDSSDNNTIKNCIITNFSYGIYINSSTLNLIYNNHLNNTQNVYLDPNISGENYFNTSLNCSGQTNIIGGPCIGGNYWTSPSGTGISDICQDLDGYGICDSEYNLTNQTAIAYDYLPLAKIHATRAGYFVKNQTFDVYGRVNITGYYFRTDLNESIADDSSTFSLGTGENVNIGENITLAWNGSAYAKSGTYTSRIFVGDNETVWKSLEIVNSTPENTSISVYYYYSDDLISWTSGNIGQTARFFRYMLVLNTSNTSITPVVYSVTINRTHKSTPGKITITLVNINNPSYTLSKTCSDTAICEKEFLFPAELPGGNYTVSITAENSSAWYENASTSFVRYFEEPVATDVVLIPDPETEVITNMTSDDYSFLINLTVVSETTTLHYPDIQLDDDGLGFKSVENLTSCPSMLSPGESCTKVFNLTVPGGKAPGLYSLIWGAVWINNNGSSGSVQNTSHVDIKSNPGLTVSPTNLTADQNLSQSQIFDFTVQNTGNVVLDNVHVYLASGTIPSSWVSFYSTSTKWNDTTDTWSYLASTEPAPLQINITVTNYTPANYSGIVNITSEYLGSPSAYQLIYLEVNVSPNFTISQTLINITQNLSQTHIQHIQINSTGNSPITNVTVTYISQNLPAS